MSLLSMLLTFLIGPLKLLFEVIFQVAYTFLHNPGLSILFLSLAMNFLVLPLYRRADALQEEARDTEARLHDGVTHIKKTFSGNERMLILQTYYRQNNYSPADSLRGTVSLLLEIPFFMAAYQFLSHLDLLQGVAFGPIANLGAPDQLLTIFGVSVNVLPILMTVINLISSAIYLRGFPLKSKIQLYAIALVFLVFLYPSPSGLVFYWTLNNLFSLVKNICYKLVSPKKRTTASSDLRQEESSTASSDRQEENAAVSAARQEERDAAVFSTRKKETRQKKNKNREYTPNARLFFCAAAFLTVLTGLLIPSTYISVSPEEFFSPAHFYHPIWYIVSASLLAAGTFFLWFGVFYRLAKPRGKVLFERILWIFCIAASVNYIFFGRDLGNLSRILQFDNGLSFTVSETVTNTVVIVLLIAALLFIFRKWSKILPVLLGALTLALTVLSAVNISQTVRYIGGIDLDAYSAAPSLSLSKTEQNVVILFLDRALGEDFPYLVQERPDLKEIYDGFTYYSNVISYGGHTNFGAPALLGGYEYTPVELNKRDDELLVDKHNESLKVLPVLFMENGYDVTVCDPPYANYNWNSDLSVYDDYPEIHKYVTKGYFGSEEAREQLIENNKRNFFCFSIMKSLPVALQYAAYDSGNYHRAGAAELEAASTQITSGKSVAEGLDADFMEAYEPLLHLEEITHITADAQKHFLFFYNDAPHEPMLLKEPEYEPAARIDNTEFDEAHADRFTLGGESIEISNTKQMKHYQSNMATMLQVGNWLAYLKEEGVYDNTKIIIVSDHGYYLYQSEVFDFPEHPVSDTHHVDIANYFPLMMVKDYGAHGFTTDDTFMTNADTPAIACEGAIDDPVNPFTGNPINSDEKTAHDQFVISSHVGWSTKTNNGTSFRACQWAAVTDNIWDRNDWEFLDDRTVLKEHQMP